MPENKFAATTSVRLRNGRRSRKLSGGNIQKVLLARELTAEAALVIFNKPTYGLDLQNTQLARERIVEGAARGVAMIVISNELDELAAISDRIAVMFQGRLNGIVANDENASRTNRSSHDWGGRLTDQLDLSRVERPTKSAASGQDRAGRSRGRARAAAHSPRAHR